MAAGVVGLLLPFIGNGGVTVGETTLPSGFAAVLVATVPLWMVLFARIVDGRPITKSTGMGLFVGLVGVAVLVGNLRGARHPRDIVIVLIAAIAWGFGSVVGHRLALPRNTMLAASVEMLVGSVALLACAGFTGEFARVHLGTVAARSWIALAFLIVFGSILTYSAYGYALAHLSVSTVSTYAFVNPVVAVIAGALFLAERLSVREGIGAVLVVGSIVLTQSRARKREPVCDALTSTMASDT